MQKPILWLICSLGFLKGQGTNPQIYQALDFAHYFDEIKLTSVVLVNDDQEDQDLSNFFFFNKALFLQTVSIEVDQVNKVLVNDPTDNTFIFESIQESTLNVLKSMTDVVLAKNFFVFVVKDKNLWQNKFDGVKNLTVNSMVFVVTPYAAFEVYKVKVGHDKATIKSVGSRYDSVWIVTSEYIWDRRHDLDGITLRSTFFPAAPYATIDTIGNNGTGFFYEVVLYLGHTLNFSVKYIESDGYSWTSVDPQVWKT